METPDNVKYKILVVEDNMSVLEALKSLLAINGYQVTTATNGSEALEALNQDKPDMIISDIMMPIMDGLEFYKNLRNEPDWHEIPFVFLTALGRDKDVREGKKLGVDDYIKKPFSSEDLLAVVQGKIARMKSLKSMSHRQKLNFVREEIIKALSHEFRTPLTKIKGYVELIQNGLYENEDQIKEFANHIAESGIQLEAVIDEFITMTRFELRANNEKSDIESDLVEAVFVAKNAKDKVAALAQNKRIKLNLHEPAHPLLINVCQQDVTEGLYHLLLNAIKFSPAESHVDLRVLNQDTMVVFEVQDYGPGIESENLTRIFDKFYQVNRSELEQQGIGMGLAITKIAAEMNKGTVSVESEPGQGTTFRMTFPVL